MTTNGIVSWMKSCNHKNEKKKIASRERVDEFFCVLCKFYPSFHSTERQTNVHAPEWVVDVTSWICAVFSVAVKSNFDNCWKIVTMLSKQQQQQTNHTKKIGFLFRFYHSGRCLHFQFVADKINLTLLIHPQNRRSSHNASISLHFISVWTWHVILIALHTFNCFLRPRLLLDKTILKSKSFVWVTSSIVLMDFRWGREFMASKWVTL